MRLDKNADNQNVKHLKGWGYELWIENSHLYCGKLLHFYANKRTSLHYHVNKTETMHLANGRIDIRLIEPETGTRYTVELFPGDSLLIPPGHCHEIYAWVESDLYEFSTIHEDSDSYRVQKGD